MAAVMVEVGEAIASQLNAAVEAGDLTPSFTAERSYADWDELLQSKDSKYVKVDVVVITADVELDDRTTLKYTCTTHIGVRKTFTRAEVDGGGKGKIAIDEIDAMVNLVEQIGVLFAPVSSDGGRLTEFDVSVWEEFKAGMWFNRKHLRENDQFTGIVRVVQDVSREI